MAVKVLTSIETIRLIRDVEKGRAGGRGRLYTYVYTVTTRMTGIKMGSDERGGVPIKRRN